ncbi:MAG: RdgB/HAM1 family non-canonical purine NTP pyrophosphatase [Bacilli bacterium]|nr:RdgB/HAM1 family non-canonical purine NTP pyrophosphatase [Bacilli bacterium]
MNKEIVIATNNRGKQKEYLEMLNPIGYMVLTPRDLCVESNPEENGKDYRENSYIKALSLSRLVHRPVIADDSGFEVEALDGFPGLHSSRFADEFGGDYRKAGEALNEKLGDNPNRNAKFHCCICLLENENDKPLFFEGDFKGQLLKDKKGDNGFGYDPFFHSEELNLDMGLASDETKNKVSHRAKALSKLLVYLAIK